MGVVSGFPANQRNWPSKPDQFFRGEAYSKVRDGDKDGLGGHVSQIENENGYENEYEKDKNVLLLVAQGFDGVEAGGAPGGIPAECDADHDGGAEGLKNGEDVDACRRALSKDQLPKKR